MGSSWWDNQFISLNNNTAHNREFSLALAILGALVLIHSVSLHGRSFNRVRILTDSVAASCVLAGAGIFWSTIVVKQATIAIGCDVFLYGIAGSVTGAVDVLITYSRFQLLSRPVFKYQDAVVGLYVFILIIVSNLSFYTWTPAFANDNTSALFWVNVFLYYVFCPAIIVFNGVFGIWFFIRAVGYNNGKIVPIEQHPKMVVLGYKSLIHASARFIYQLLVLFLVCLTLYLFVVPQ
jgi:hypothetical protein